MEKKKKSHWLQTSSLGTGALHVLSESQAELVQLLLQHSELPLDDQDVLWGHKEAKSEGQTAPEAVNGGGVVSLWSSSSRFF